MVETMAELMEGILEPEKLAEAERKHGITLREAADIVKGLREKTGPERFERFDPMEREAILFLGACWKCGYITKELFDELYGSTESAIH